MIFICVASFICIFLSSPALPETETFQDVVVEIERATHRKAFLGGYRHKATETEYHHAAVQTIAKRKPIRGVGTFSRDTQVHTHYC